MKSWKSPYQWGFLFFSLVIGFLVNRGVELYTLTPGNYYTKLDFTIRHLSSTLIARPMAISTLPAALGGWTLGVISVWLIYLYHFGVSSNYQRGQEHGSARWGKHQDIAPLMNSRHPDQNIILSATEALNFAPATNFKYERNHNVLVIGGSGSGKTYSHLKPNLMQLHSSYVVTDPKGTILGDVGFLLEKSGYQIKVFDTVNFARSLRYNPLAYLHTEADVLKLANVIIANTKGEGRVGDDFWVKAERLWLSACLGYLYSQVPLADRNLPALLDLLAVAGASETDEKYQCPLDVMFEELALSQPDCFPVRQYQKFKLAAGNTAKSILISVAARLSPFDLPTVRDLMITDELQLTQLGEHKTALFVVMSDTDPTYSFLSAMLFYQMFDVLCVQADSLPTGKLKVPVRLLLDEFANLGVLPHFDKTIATIRSRDLSATIILQSLAQLTTLYPKQAEVIVDCCDTVVFLGGKSVKTTKDLAAMIGRTTINHQSISQSHGEHGNYSLSQQVISRSLIDPSEIAKMGRDECLVLITGLPPFRSRKYNPTRHPQFKYLADSGNYPRYTLTRAQMLAPATKSPTGENLSSAPTTLADLLTGVKEVAAPFAWSTSS